MKPSLGDTYDNTRSNDDDTRDIDGIAMNFDGANSRDPHFLSALRYFEPSSNTL